MESSGLRPTRRGVLGVGAVTALALAAVVPTGGRVLASTSDDNDNDNDKDNEEIIERLRRLEEGHSARLGVFALDTVTGRRVAYRQDERFPMCSVFKTIAVAAVLRDLDRDGEFLAERIRYTEQDVTRSGYAPITGLPENVADGMTVADLCAAAVAHSDNTAANLLLRELGRRHGGHAGDGGHGEHGGPPAVTGFCRSIGDDVTRLDRLEPELNSAEPWRTTDTTSPRAIGRTYARLTLGDALAPRDRKRLTRWLLANTTSANRFRAGLPNDWILADKTGTGAYGTTNDVGVAQPPGRGPLVLAVLSTKRHADARADEPLVAEAAELLATTLT
ncbi:serine hydrolase [Embleya sp. NBC_00896]|uniref:serine hydrolase n=1 Tax=Embleya sp. NBC_00896 TaxID=2975961 RepID=UPI002F90F3BE|nr:serine hydrolase [Embleya sp. NBC_00896]